MSNGELNGSQSPWAKMSLDPATLMGVVASESLAVEFASGDVEAANMRLLDEVRAAQKAVKGRREELAKRQEALREQLEGVELPDRPIDFEFGQALGAVDFSDPEDPHLDPKTVGEDMAGSAGTITGFEVGTFLGKPLDSPEAIVLWVDMSHDSELLCAGIDGYRYGVVANQSDYSIGEIPQPEE